MSAEISTGEMIANLRDEIKLLEKLAEELRGRLALLTRPPCESCDGKGKVRFFETSATERGKLVPMEAKCGRCGGSGKEP